MKLVNFVNRHFEGDLRFDLTEVEKTGVVCLSLHSEEDQAALQEKRYRDISQEGLERLVKEIHCVRRRKQLSMTPHLETRLWRPLQSPLEDGYYWAKMNGKISLCEAVGGRLYTVDGLHPGWGLCFEPIEITEAKPNELDGVV